MDQGRHRSASSFSPMPVRSFHLVFLSFLLVVASSVVVAAVSAPSPPSAAVPVESSWLSSSPPPSSSSLLTAATAARRRRRRWRAPGDDFGRPLSVRGGEGGGGGGGETAEEENDDSNVAREGNGGQKSSPNSFAETTTETGAACDDDDLYVAAGVLSLTARPTAGSAPLAEDTEGATTTAIVCLAPPSSTRMTAQRQRRQRVDDSNEAHGGEGEWEEVVRWRRAPAPSSPAAAAALKDAKDLEASTWETIGCLSDVIVLRVCDGGGAGDDNGDDERMRGLARGVRRRHRLDASSSSLSSKILLVASSSSSSSLKGEASTTTSSSIEAAERWRNRLVSHYDIPSDDVTVISTMGVAWAVVGRIAPRLRVKDGEIKGEGRVPMSSFGIMADRVQDSIVGRRRGGGEQTAGRWSLERFDRGERAVGDHGDGEQKTIHHAAAVASASAAEVDPKSELQSVSGEPVVPDGRDDNAASADDEENVNGIKAVISNGGDTKGKGNDTIATSTHLVDDAIRAIRTRAIQTAESAMERLESKLDAVCLEPDVRPPILEFRSDADEILKKVSDAFDDVAVGSDGTSDDDNRAHVEERRIDAMRETAALNGLGRLYQQHLQCLREHHGRRYEAALDQASAEAEREAEEDESGRRRSSSSREDKAKRRDAVLADAAKRATEGFRAAASAAVPTVCRPGGPLHSNVDDEYNWTATLDGLLRDMMDATSMLEGMERDWDAASSSLLGGDGDGNDDEGNATGKWRPWRRRRRQGPAKWYEKLAARAVVLGVNYLQGWLALQGLRRAAAERDREMPKFPLF